MVWAMMKAHAVQEDLIEKNFCAHPAVNHTLNVHLQDNSVPRSAHDALDKKVKDLIQKVQNQSKTIDILKSKS